MEVYKSCIPHLSCFVCFAVIRNQSLEKEIELLIKGITHESMDVRQVALSKLRCLLHNNQTELHRLIVKGERVNPVVENLINMVKTVEYYLLEPPS